MQVIQFIAIGLLAGAVAGLLGIGGAVVIVPILVYVYGWEQHLAQGTTLAMLVPPIGILAALKYYQAGHMDLKVAAFLCVGFFVGSYFGGVFANQLPADTLRKVFGIFLLAVSIKMILGK